MLRAIAIFLYLSMTVSLFDIIFGGGMLLFATLALLGSILNVLGLT